MIKFNDNNIIVGYIKQMLNEFNLPIDLQNATKSDIRNINNYHKHLLINNIYYDGYTHRYLGDYLRYVRDKKNINLMQMYNCFSNETISRMNITINNINFDSTSSDYKLYCVKVLPNTEYTIAISSPYYHMTYVNVDSNNVYYSVANSTIIKKNSSFDKPYLLKTPTFENYSSLNDCRLLIKLPIDSKSSIVILEGNYVDVNQYTSNKDNETFYKSCITNFEHTSNLQFKSRSQLLVINSGVSFPFADKLIGYLVDNTITSKDTIGDNIQRLQEKLKEKEYISSYAYPGIWDSKYSDYINYIKNKNRLPRNSFDVLGYVDKDVERVLGEDVDIY